MKKIILLICVAGLLASCEHKSSQTQLPAYEEGFIQIDPSVRIFYQKVGSGDQVTIIPAGWWLYEDFKHLVNQDRTFIFFDMRNRGRADFVKDTSLISINREVEDIETIRKHFKVEKVSLIGWSYLGLLVMLYTEKYPDNIDKLIQIGPVPLKWTTSFPDSLKNTEKIPELETAGAFVDSLIRAKYNEAEPEKFTRLQWDTLIRKQLVGDIKDEYKLGAHWGDHVKYSNEWDVNFYRHLIYHFGSIQKLTATKEQFSKLQQKLLVIHGTKDRNAPFGAGKEWATLLPNAQLLRVKGAAHVPWADYPQIVFPAVDEFLAGQWPAAANKP